MAQTISEPITLRVKQALLFVGSQIIAVRAETYLLLYREPAECHEIFHFL